MTTRLNILDITRPRRQRALRALKDAAHYVAAHHDAEGVLIIISDRTGKRSKVITAGSLENTNAATLALVKTKLTLVTS